MVLFNDNHRSRNSMASTTYGEITETSSLVILDIVKSMNQLTARDSSLVDIGCGSGTFCHLAAARKDFHKVFGIEVVGERLEVAASIGREVHGSTFHSISIGASNTKSASQRVKRLDKRLTF